MNIQHRDTENTEEHRVFFNNGAGVSGSLGVNLAHVIASEAKQSRGKRHNVNSNSGLLRSARNDVSEFLEVPSTFFYSKKIISFLIHNSKKNCIFAFYLFFIYLCNYDKNDNHTT